MRAVNHERQRRASKAAATAASRATVSRHGEKREKRSNLARRRADRLSSPSISERRHHAISEAIQISIV